MYRPPNSQVEFYDRFENFIDHVMREKNEIILIGDFNIKKTLLTRTLRQNGLLLPQV